MSDEIFSIVFNYGTKEKPVIIYERIEGTSVVELCSKLVLLIGKVTHQIAEQKAIEARFKNTNIDPDDIPF